VDETAGTLCRTLRVLFWLHLPAALLLGPMIAGITLSLRGAKFAFRGRFLLPLRPLSAA
jgi:uncharacterized membrane protein AbrB (regulator of aidB expression)